MVYRNLDNSDDSTVYPDPGISEIPRPRLAGVAHTSEIAQEGAN